MISVRKKIMVHAYKRNGWLYRVWEFPKVVAMTDEYICVSLYNSRVITNEKNSSRNFHSKNLKPSFWFFFYDKWYNIIATLTPNDTLNYYVNFASPFIHEEEAIKYYDFDVDIKMKNNVLDEYKILDLDEYDENKVAYRYEKQILSQIEKRLKLFQDESFRKSIFEKINIDLINEYIKIEQQE
ncbi:DUF402 domain-containing protein [Malacoplasma iowae]|uniref:DUF402 domain-containing protein n=1 Tax=Malacoplasma iowae 695 TaxID=1048830 RepID=A0A6P1LDU8_MALIO|nr:DUF402 domain-containing protein [Malacoplasma iowae]QHG89639.1 DUF402 domain-containing protein [Malacoplasma iowae 695]WPL35577.1 DUF402 domain-containing protein [Malacoplasma iowae]VEU63351.1 Protein of uncharacterised function (DUF402) [Mycoplasmopsis fermentans]VEU72072.1 Protein of uncharacterised function (DUF402) [Malacoplasma iowae]